VAMMTWSTKNPTVKSKSPLPGTPNIEVVYNTSTGIATRAAHCGSLLEGLRLSTLEEDEHRGLRCSGRHSVIPYVHEEDCCIIVYILQAIVELV
jgi:hypothetical protein